MRVVFDVSVLIRFALGSTLAARLLERAANGEYSILSNDLLIEELTRTAAKPRLAARLDQAARDDLLAFLRNVAEQVRIAPPYPGCRDPDDGYLLALARDGRANYLVTNDEDLLCLSPMGECAILTPEAFSQRLHGR